MDGLRLHRSQRMGSPPSTNLHNLMPPPASQAGGDQHHDLLRLLPEHHGHPGHHLLGMPQHLGGSSMKYPGTPPDTPPSSSPTSPYHHLGVITSASASGTTSIGLDVTELVWRGYPVNNNQDQVLVNFIPWRLSVSQEYWPCHKILTKNTKTNTNTKLNTNTS